MFDTLIHKFLHVPYKLYVHTDQRVKSPRTTVLLLHGMGESGAAWDDLVKKLPDNLRIISVDLLGFGNSPKPRWLKYDVRVQARSVIATLMRLRIRRPLVVVGHSMGSLTAVELARRYPLIVKALVLCSPPFYTNEERRQLVPDRNRILQNFYHSLLKNPHKIVKAVPLAMRLKIVGKAFDVTEDNVDIYVAALESSIIQQSSLEDVKNIRKPMHILHGALDPVVIKKNLDGVIDENTNATLSVVLAGHELMGAYIPAIVKAVEKFVPGEVNQ